MALRHAPLGVVRWKAGPQDPWPSCTASLDASFCGLRARIALAAARMASATTPDHHRMISRRHHAGPARPGHRAAMALPALAASMRVRGQSRPPWPSAFVACWSPLVKSGCENSRGGLEVVSHRHRMCDFCDCFFLHTHHELTTYSASKSFQTARRCFPRPLKMNIFSWTLKL